MAVNSLKDAAKEISRLEAMVKGLEEENADLKKKLKATTKKKPAAKESAES